ncbi:hypothetical protein PSPHG_CDS_0173 [Pseudomonas phage Psxphi15]
MKSCGRKSYSEPVPDSWLAGFWQVHLRTDVGTSL